MPRRDEKSHFYQLARLAIALSIGEVPSVASALPSCCVVIKPVDLLVGAAGWHGILNCDGGASMRIWGEGICSDAARRVAIKGAASFMRVSQKLISGCGRNLDYDVACRVAPKNHRVAFNNTTSRLKPPCRI